MLSKLFTPPCGEIRWWVSRRVARRKTARLENDPFLPPAVHGALRELCGKRAQEWREMLVGVHPENVPNLGYDEDHCDAGVTWVSFGMMRVLERQRLEEGEALKRKRLAAWRAEGGDRHPGTLGALANLASNLQEQRKLAEAEPLLREVVAASREVSAAADQSTESAIKDEATQSMIKDIGNLGELCLAQGKLDEAEPLLVEAVTFARKNAGWGGPYLGSLVELRREQGRLAEAAQELGSLVADLRKGAGPQHPLTLEAEAVTARLRHAQGGAGAVAELRATVQRMGKYMGAADPDTVKWCRVLRKIN